MQSQRLRNHALILVWALIVAVVVFSYGYSTGDTLVGYIAGAVIAVASVGLIVTLVKMRRARRRERSG